MVAAICSKRERVAVLPDVALGPSVLGQVPSPLSLQALLFYGRKDVDTGSGEKESTELGPRDPTVRPVLWRPEYLFLVGS